MIDIAKIIEELTASPNRHRTGATNNRDTTMAKIVDDVIAEHAAKEQIEESITANGSGLSVDARPDDTVLLS
jgi:ATP-dependent Clp protease ATP-binding subunit ClpA